MSSDANKGGVAIDVIIGAALLIFVILPLFSVAIERFILINKTQIARDALDMANISVYNSLNTVELGRYDVSFESDRTMKIYREMLSENLKLDAELKPLLQSIAEDTVSIESVVIYTGGLPAVCPNGTELSRPSVHSCVSIPIRPTLYRQILSGMSGNEYINIKVHMDSEIPLDN